MPGFKEDRDVFSNNGSVQAEKIKKVEPIRTNSTVVNMTKVFFYMFIGLALTAAIAFGLGYIIASSCAKAVAAGGSGDNVLLPYVGVMVGSAIGLFILMIIINFVVIRGRHSVLVPSILYAVLVGVLFSSFTIFVDWRLLGMAFGITSGIFLLMTGISAITKGSLNSLATLAIGLLLGAIILSLVNFFLMNETVYWIVSFVIFAAVMFIAMWDVHNIKKICEQGNMSNNLAYYCAFIMYVDFINVFVRILFYLLIIFAKRK